MDDRVKDNVMSNYVKSICKTCNVEFERYRAHPYIIKCKKCRKSYSRQKKTAGITKIDGVVIHRHIIQRIIYMTKLDYRGKIDIDGFPLSISTYIKSKQDRRRFWRIGSEYFMSLDELAAIFPQFISDIKDNI